MDTTTPSPADAATSRCQIFHEPKRFSRRTRSGCSTCRTRKIKCDEARPFCANCKKSRLSCPGYQTLPRKSRQYFRSPSRASFPSQHLYASHDTLSMQSLEQSCSSEFCPIPVINRNDVSSKPKLEFDAFLLSLKPPAEKHSIDCLRALNYFIMRQPVPCSELPDNPYLEVLGNEPFKHIANAL